MRRDTQNSLLFTPGLVLAVLLALTVPATATPLAAADDDDIEEIEEIEEIEDVDVDVAKPFDRVDPETWRPENYPIFERVVNIPTALTGRQFETRFIIDHRTFEAFTENPFQEMFGFDSGLLKIGLGVRFSALDSLEFGIYRLNSGSVAFDVYEFDAKFQALRQDEHYLNLAVRAGATWFSQRGREDAAGGFAQLIVDRLLFDRLRIGTGLLFHSDSTDDTKVAQDTDWSIAIPAYVDIRILDWLAWNLEVAVPVAGFRGEWPNFSSSVKFITHRHTFALVLSNNQHMGADGIVAGSGRGFGDLIIGFSITRTL